MLLFTIHLYIMIILKHLIKNLYVKVINILISIYLLMLIVQVRTPKIKMATHRP